MNNLFRKINSKSGETLVETMASILIFTLSSIILLTMITTSAKLNAAARDSDEKISEEFNVAESREAENGEPDCITLTAKVGSDNMTQKIETTKYSSGDGTLYSYNAKEVTE